MLHTLLTVGLLALPAPPDTTVVLGLLERDLTGDGQLEVLRLQGVGESTDSLTVTFTIEAGDRVLYRASHLPVTKTVGYDAGRRLLSAEEHADRLAEYGAFFFADEKFQSPEQFVEDWLMNGRHHVLLIPEVIARDARRQVVIDSLVSEGQELETATQGSWRLLGDTNSPEALARGEGVWMSIQRSRMTVFEYSPGGDSVIPIAWSEAEGRFYRLVECC
jgi:hypothetical protein